MAESQSRTTYRDVFAVGEFRALFAAHLLSVVGDQFARVALAVLVYQRTGSPALTALTYALTFLPDLVARPLLAGLADRFPRRRVMVLTDLGRAGLVAAMAVPGLPLPWLFVLLVAVQVLAAPFDAARSATLPVVFGSTRERRDDRYVVASTVSDMVYQAAQVLGFAGAGLLLVGVNPSGALLVDAVTFLVSAAVIRAWVVDRPSAAADGDGGLRAWGRRIAAGARTTWSDRDQRFLLALLCVPMFPVVVEGLAVPYADQLRVPAAALGLLFAAEPCGALVGMLLVTRLEPARRLRLITPLAVVSCAVLVVCAARPGLWGSVAVFAASGLASAYFSPAAARFVESTPDEQRGLASGLANAVVRATQGLGVVAGGVLALVVAPSTVIAVAGVVGAVFAWVVGRSWVRAAAGGGAETPAGDA